MFENAKRAALVNKQDEPDHVGISSFPIVEEEERVLARVLRTVDARQKAARTRRDSGIDYDAEMLALRDQILEARTEDIPPLVEEMQRLERVAMSRAKVTEGSVDPRNPYFGRMVLEEEERKREILIGRSTFLDPKTGVRIVDWRDAPISRIYYRYEEGDDFDEPLGGRDVEGDVLLRRSVSIFKGQLRRVQAPQGSYMRGRTGWREMGRESRELSGGQGAALRIERHHTLERGKLGIGTGEFVAEDKHLAEITALIDPHQFDLITRPDSGLVVIQGGAGSGKTTIGLHRLAYLAFQDRQRFAPQRMLVLVFNRALVRYISRVLPALGVEGVRVSTYEEWASRLRRFTLAHTTDDYADNTPSVVARIKKDAAMLRMIDGFLFELAGDFDRSLKELLHGKDGSTEVFTSWKATEGQPLRSRITNLRERVVGDEGKALIARFSSATQHSIQVLLDEMLEKLGDTLQLWFELLTDSQRLSKYFSKDNAYSSEELSRFLSWTAQRCEAVIVMRDFRADPGDKEETVETGVDGVSVDENAALDREDDAILLRLHQRMIGPIVNRKGKPIGYSHLFVDETQDLSPVELAVAVEMSRLSPGQEPSITMAGDVAQRLYMSNGFTTWARVLNDLSLSHTTVEPLKLSYRSTREILDFATHVLGHLRHEVEAVATRSGAPVEIFSFGATGEAVAFLSEALRNLVRTEPLASVCVIARYPEQADDYYRGLVRGEVPNVRRVSDQDFSFRSGVDVTDIRQVKGLEFDYVVLVEATTANYPIDDEARHLLHIGATRAAHQLWVLAGQYPSQLLPSSSG